jgi:hypothetical protein
MTTQPQSPSEQEIRNITSEYSFEPGHEDECALFDDEDCNCKYRRDWELWNEMHQRIADLIAQAADKREQEYEAAMLGGKIKVYSDVWGMIKSGSTLEQIAAWTTRQRDNATTRTTQLRQGGA